MSIFLSVLAVIGKILLIILLVLIALLLIVLFVPIRFKLDANLDRVDFDGVDFGTFGIKLKSNATQENLNQFKTDTKEDGSGQPSGMEQLKSKLHLSAGLHWLLYLVRGLVNLNATKNDEISLKVLFFRLYPKKEKEDTKKKATAKNQDEKNTEKISNNTEEKKTEKISNNTEEKKTEKISNNTEEKKTDRITNCQITTAVKEKESTHADTAAKEKTGTTEAEITEAKSILSFFFFLWKVFGVILSVINKPYAVFQKFLYTISGICDKISLVRDLLETDMFERGKTVLLRQVKRLLKGLVPKKCKADIAYGAGDPCLTAEILAVYSVFSPLFRGHIRIRPDFDKKFIEGEIHLKGRLTLFRIIWSLAMVYFNKDLRRVKKRLEYIKNLK